MGGLGENTEKAAQTTLNGSLLQLTFRRQVVPQYKSKLAGGILPTGQLAYFMSDYLIRRNT